VTPDHVLCVNVGSSSLKLALFGWGGDGPEEQWRWSGAAVPGRPVELRPAVDELLAEGFPLPAAVGHRVVHGGNRHEVAAAVDDALLAELHALTSLAPLHQPGCLAGIDAARAALPEAVHVACFDTAFHQTMPPEATHFGLPHEAWERGVRRYGFHGLSYEYVVGRVGPRELGRAVVAHLGAGASLCAVVDGASVDTTMGLTPTGGLVMATRSGDLDPGVVLHLLRHGAPDGGPLDLDTVAHLLDHDSGLRGLSGGSADMEALLAAREAGNASAALAVEVFCRTAAKHAAALVAVMGGIDTLVFTAGIGEHAPAVRAEIAERLGFLGMQLDPAANDAAAPVISGGGSAVTVRVVPTDEDLVIARHVGALLG
jgi:acetate kinase